MKNKLMVLFLVLLLFIPISSVCGASEILSDNENNADLNINNLNDLSLESNDNSSVESIKLSDSSESNSIDSYSRSNYLSTYSFSSSNSLLADNHINTYINYTTTELNSTSYFGLNLYDENNNALANQTVLFSINTRDYKVITDDLGYAQLRINLNPSTYEFNLTYFGNGKYNPSKETLNLTVNKGFTSFIGSDLVMYAGSGQHYNFKLVNGLNQSLPNRQVVININTVDYYLTTNVDGIASIQINLRNGEYGLKYFFRDTLVLNPSQGTSHLTVLYNSTHFVASDLSMNSTNRSPFTVYLYDVFNNTLANKTVTFTINGVSYNKTTDSSAKASLNINLLTGVYPIEYSYFNKAPLVCSYGSSLINIIGMPTYVSVGSTDFKYRAENYFKVTVTNNESEVLTDRVVKFTVNGVTYTTGTNENGVARLKINLRPGFYNMVYQVVAHYKYASFRGESNFIVNGTFLFGSDSTIYPYRNAPYTATLLDLFNNPISGARIVFSVNGLQYEGITNDRGEATVNINLLVGSYPINYKFYGTEEFLPVEGSSIIHVVKLSNNNYIWLNAANMDTVDLKYISNNNVGNILLNFYAFTKYGESGVLNFISRAESYGLSVHIWMQCFYDGGWINPNTCGQGYINSKFSEAMYYASLPGVAGVHLDYLRFPGTAYKNPGGLRIINIFTQQITDLIHNINGKAIVSGAIMPEPSKNVYYYGQDINTLGKHLDVIMPMVYKGNYHQNANWIKSVTSYFEAHSSKAKIVTGLQTYRSDSSLISLPTAELAQDVSYAYAGGAEGVALFKWGLVNLVPV